jgi:hypothetical protein
LGYEILTTFGFGLP